MGKEILDLHASLVVLFNKPPLGFLLPFSERGMKICSNPRRKISSCWKLVLCLSIMIGLSCSHAANPPIYNMTLTVDQEKWVMSKGEFDEETCAVCLETYKPREVVRILTCRHVFHRRCIDYWLLQRGICPLCNYIRGRQDTFKYLI
uniref:RING-type domain-containing protein n=1 Tax=Varanus komodoensis TaxID=61221 RepID=A0A8D2Q6U8_VARKO